MDSIFSHCYFRLFFMEIYKSFQIRFTNSYFSLCFLYRLQLFSSPYLKFMNSAIKSFIHEYFSTNPRLFARSIAVLKRNNIRCLSQCITDNGFALLTYNTIIRNHLSHCTSSITSSWYLHLQSLLCVSPTSLKLVSPISDPDLLPHSEFFPFPTLTHSNARRVQE